MIKYDNMSGVSNQLVKYTTLIRYNTLRNVLLGVGLGYAIQNKHYLHVPVIFIIPSIYIGYQGYQNRDNIMNYIKELNL